MDYVTQDDILLVLRQSAAPQTPRILIEALNPDGTVAGEIEGIVSGNMSIDSASDIRRTGSIVVQPTRKQSILLEENNLIWIDKDFRMSLGLYWAKDKEYKWYSLGYFVYTNTSLTYDATNNQLTVQFSDWMAKLDGTKNGTLGYYSMSFPAKPGDFDYCGTASYSSNKYTVSKLYSSGTFNNGVPKNDGTVADYTEYDATNEGELIGVYVTATNTESPTINICGLGEMTILSYRTTEGLEAGRMQANHINILRVETTQKDGVVSKNIYFDSYMSEDLYGSGYTPEFKTPSIIRNVIVEVLEQYAEFIGTNYIVGDVGAPRAFPSVNEDWQAYRNANVDLWNTVPYDIDFSTGATVLSILTTFRDLYSGYFEMFFEPEKNTFICQIIPTLKNDSYFIENDFIQRVLISEQTTVNLLTVRNVCEVWGQTFEPDFYGTEVTYSGNVYSCYIEGYDDQYYNGDIVALKLPSVNTAAGTCINLNGYGNVTIYNESIIQPIAKNEIAEAGTHVFKIYKKRDSKTKTDTLRAYHLGMWQVHAMNVLHDGSTDSIDYKFSDGTTLKKFSKAYFQKKYNCNRVDFNYIAESPFTVQKLGEILDVKSGGDYDNITSDDDAAYRAKIDNDTNCRLTDSIQITTALLPFLDVNKKITYRPENDSVIHEYVIKSIQHDFQGFTSSITLERYYEDAS